MHPSPAWSHALRYPWPGIPCILACLLLLGIAGCGAATARLKGKVLKGGQPVANAQIELAPVNDATKNYRGISVPGGDYQIDYGEAGGLPLGDYRVTVAIYQTPSGGLLPAGEEGESLKNSGQAVERRYVLDLKIDKHTSQVDLDLDKAQPQQ